MNTVNNKIISIFSSPNPIWTAGQRTRPNPLFILSKKEKEDFISFLDFAFFVLEIEMDFKKWAEMTSGERISLIREIKLKKIIKDES